MDPLDAARHANADPARVLVLYASETGTAQDVAETIAQMAANRALADTHLSAMDACPLAALLPRCRLAIFVVATTGDGDAPENMRQAWRSLLRKSLPGDWLRGVQIAVFGLGDSSYAKYNAVARRLDARLRQLGATELIPRGLGDDQHALGLFGALLPWLDQLWPAVLREFPLPDGFVVDDTAKRTPPRYRVSVQRDRQSEAMQPGKVLDPRQDASTFFAPPRDALNRDAGICMARLTENRRLTAEDWSQDVRHLVFELDRDDISFDAGAVAVVYPENTTGVDDMLAYYDLVERDQCISIQAADGTVQQDFPPSVIARDLFAKYLDILGTPRRSFFAKLSLYAADAEEKEKLEEIASPEGVDLLYDYCIREKKTYVEVLKDFPTAKLPLDMLLELVPRLKPRSYSISSSCRMFPGQVHLTVAIVDFLTPYKRRRLGLCSAYFRSLDPSQGQIRVPMWIKRGLISTPDPSKGLLMISPGTGLAAMRAILQERQILAAIQGTSKTASKGAEAVSTRLFFGCRHEAKDFLYADELQAMVSSGTLTSLHTAFSRDQAFKIYVQTRLAECKDTVYAMLTGGAYVFVAGSAKRMPSDVHDVLCDILRSVGHASTQEADAFLKKLARSKRYIVESWS